MNVRRPRTQGQALVEFAFVIPVFLLIIFGLIDMSRFVYTDSVLSQAAREGARLGAVEASWVGSTDSACNTGGGPVCPANVDSLVADVTSAANRMIAGLGGSITNVSVSCDPPGAQPTGAWTGTSCSTRATGNIVSIRVIYTYQPLTPVIGQLIGSVSRSGSATMVIN